LGDDSGEHSEKAAEDSQHKGILTRPKTFLIRIRARCLGVEEAAKRLEEVHDKVCGTTTPVNLSRRLQRQGDYWPNMARDAKAREDIII